ncbi:MAG: hydrogenase nickel incorporation protein HypB [Haliscomenobacter sp.]|nr:hydrogenase nickel incorporation protein HypB [Haliscomenobacter sp.]
MCTTCGCSSHEDGVSITRVGDDAQHQHQHLSGWGRFWHFLWYGPHQHNAPAAVSAHTGEKKIIHLEQDILAKNNQSAQRNRGYFEAKNILALNLVSSPGSGKTALLERTLHDLREKMNFAVIEGDQQTTQDADRIVATGAPVVQINTGQGCHLDADMVYRALHELHPAEDAVVMIENVGNLVCPAMFDLGETARVVIISVTEGDDKPIKYPDMFHSAQLCLINKIDLLPYVKFDLERAKDFARRVNPNLEFIAVSATAGTGMEAWYQWLLARPRVKLNLAPVGQEKITYAVVQ